MGSNEISSSQPTRVSTMVKRLSSMLEREYGVKFSYVEVSEVSDRLKDQLVSETSLSPSKCPTINSDIYFPIIVQKKFFGAGVISSKDVRGTHDVKKINDVIQLILCPIVASVDRVQTLQRLEGQLEDLETQERTNVVSLEGFRKSRVGVSTPVEKPRNTRFNMPCYIQCDDLAAGQKMAIEIHNKSFRFAFVSVYDLTPNALIQAETLRDLGEVSIFIPDLAEMNNEEQKGLLSYLNGARGKYSPQIIACCRQSPVDLINEGWIDPELVKRLSVAQLKIDQSFDRYKSEKITQFFFDSLTAGPEDSPTPNL